MKKIILALVALFIVSTFIACSDDEGSGEIQMKIEEIQFTARGGETDIKFTVDGSYKIDVDQSWIESWGEDRSLVVKASPFFSGVKRVGAITVTTKTSTRKILVTQFPDQFKIKGGGLLYTSLLHKKEQKVSVSNSFKGDLSRINLLLKDKEDAEWLSASFLNESEVLIKTETNPFLKPKEAVIYVVVDGDIEKTVMDSLTVKSIMTKEDIFESKWVASFLNEKKTRFTHNVEITPLGNAGKFLVTGVPISENSEVQTKMTMEYKELQNEIHIVMNNYSSNPILEEDDEVVNYIVAIQENNTWWEIDGYYGPSNYKGKIDAETEKGNVILSFTNFTHTHWRLGDTNVIGFMFRSYKPNGYYNYTPLETRRKLFDFKLTLVK